ncbi:MAG: FAD-dependent oxidoreductase [Terriglobales bacterium]
MTAQLSIAIVGGGPAGALAGALLAAGGSNVRLFDEKLAWEKPCGGGLTHKALRQYPFLADAGSEGNPVEHNSVAHCVLISPSGQRVRFRMQYPVAIFSRLALNGLLLERARRAGVEMHQERVTRIARAGDGWRLFTPQGEYQASRLILAAGARNPFRSQFVSPISPSDLMVTAGYFIPGHASPGHGSPGNRSLMQIQFLQGIAGYIWVFPRADHLSAGIAGRMGETSTAELRRVLEDWLEENGFHRDGARFYSHILPSFSAQSFDALEVCGEGWAMIGDSAGLVDPITGEGIYYALRSAELCANAWLAGRPGDYRIRLEEEVLPELQLAARLSHRFYSGQIFGESVLERMVSLASKSSDVRDLLSDLFAGIQSYRDLRLRLCRILPSVMAGTLRHPWNIANANISGNRGAGSRLDADQFAKQN